MTSTNIDVAFHLARNARWENIGGFKISQKRCLHVKSNTGKRI
jgi:hypothetical protein